MTPDYLKSAKTNLSDFRRFSGIIVIVFVKTSVVVNLPVTIDEVAIGVNVVNR